MIRWGVVLLSVSAAAGTNHGRHEGVLPHCSNRVINEVVEREGCTVGDWRCWNRHGGFCADYIEKRAGGNRGPQKVQMAPIPPDELREGDVAVFASRAHYAWIERVVRDRRGRPVAIDLSEFNYGTCWVDLENMVTDKYKIVNRRSGVPVADVDGGFLRARAAGR